MKILGILLIFGTLLHPSDAYFKECYVTPCTRDVIIVVDGSSDMQTSTYISQEINVITKLVYDWTLSQTQVRLALVGAYFGNDFSGINYFTDTSTVEKRLQQFRVSSMQYGLFAGDFNTTVRFLDERYVGTKAIYPPRDGVQKRIIIFTSHGKTNDVASTKSKLEQFASLGYQVTIVGIGQTESAYKSTSYHKFVPISFSELPSVSQSVIDTIIEDGICFYDAGVPTPKPQTCTTAAPTTKTTQPTTTKPPTANPAAPTVKTTTPKPIPPTHTPFPVGDYQNCSCSSADLYLDIVFVVDTSIGMGDDGLMVVKAEINTLVGQMTLDPNQKQHVQVGLVKYSDKAEIVFHPYDYSDEDQFTEDLWDDARLQTVDSAEEVNLDLGLEKAETLLSQMRDGVYKVIVIYAASYDDIGEHDPVRIAERIRESGHTIVTVAYEESGTLEPVSKIGEIASKRMNFTSYRDDLLVEEVLDAFCQVNCYCPEGWHQLVLENRKYGECFFETEIDANWLATKYECPALTTEHSGNGHLIYINSALKNNFLNHWFMDHWNELNKEVPNYDIGFYYNSTFSKFVWINGVTNNPYTNWLTGHPDLSIGDCAKAIRVNGTSGDANDFDFKWVSINCMSDHGRGLCQSTTCDTSFYCKPEIN